MKKIRLLTILGAMSILAACSNTTSSTKRFIVDTQKLTAETLQLPSLDVSISSANSEIATAYVEGDEIKVSYNGYGSTILTVAYTGDSRAGENGTPTNVKIEVVSHKSGTSYAIIHEEISASLSDNIKKTWASDDQVAVYAKAVGSDTKWVTFRATDGASTETIKAVNYPGVADSSYKFFYPVSRAKETVSFKSQSVSASGNEDSIKQYNYYVAQSNKVSGIEMKPVCSKLVFRITNLPSTAIFKRAVLFCDNYPMVLEGEVDFSTGFITPTETSTHMNYTINSVKGTDNEEFDFIVMTAPMDLSTKKIALTFIDDKNNYYALSRIHFTTDITATTYTGNESSFSDTNKKFTAGNVYYSEVIDAEAFPHNVTLKDGLVVANHNVGSFSKDDPGYYFKWNELSTALSKDENFKESGKYRLMTKNDALIISGLRAEPFISDTRYTKVYGEEGTSYSDNYVLFPAGGYYLGDTNLSKECEGNFWLKESFESNKAYSLYTDSTGCGVTSCDKELLFNVRPIYIGN